MSNDREEIEEESYCNCYKYDTVRVVNFCDKDYGWRNKILFLELFISFYYSFGFILIRND